MSNLLPVRFREKGNGRRAAQERHRWDRSRRDDLRSLALFPVETGAARALQNLAAQFETQRRMNVSNATNRGEGAAEELGGKIKKGIGKLIGNEQMEAEGAAKELKGEAKQEAAKAGERSKGKVEEVVGAVKNRVGQVIDNEQMAAEGKVKELQGEARQKANK